MAFERVPVSPVTKQMTKWLVTCAWPTSSDIPHLGNMVGSALSADVFARYLRLAGEEVVYVSGSDHHGTPLEVEALKKGVSPKELADSNHARISEVFKKWLISFDNYTTTESEVHKRFVREHYMRIYSHPGNIFTRAEKIHYCPFDKRFLPDRFVEGTCRFCGFGNARGDQCDNCGRPLDAEDLVEPHCVICGRRTELRETTQWFFDLPRFRDYVAAYLDRSNLSPNVISFSKAWLREGLRPRSITRDSKWGIPAPFPGAEGKTIYVWMEDVLGYVSALIEFFERSGNPDGWREFWFGKDAKTSFFIGKDNIPFHSILLPALLHASGEPYNEPSLISSTEFLTFSGQKFSKSRRIGIWCDEALSLMPADYWRYVLIALRPEGSDIDLSWASIEQIVNNELNDAFGNLVNRTLTSVKRFCGGVFAVDSSTLRPEEAEYLKEINARHLDIGTLYSEAEIKSACRKILEQATSANRYLSSTQPWSVYKTDKASGDSILYAALNAVKLISIELLPIIPGAAQEFLRQAGFFRRSKPSWSDTGLDADLPLQVGEVSPVFYKVDGSKLEETLESLRAEASAGTRA
ncbi:MAG: methionine--tRNA ligase [Candidatus Marsarchaeota archaeon]|nr:methionine--tRNA ligase [Candidatus Marsarchaeota archaeon]